VKGNTFQQQKKKSSPSHASTKKRSYSPALQEKSKPIKKYDKVKDTEE
jgi:hypothetical protein